LNLGSLTCPSEWAIGGLQPEARARRWNHAHPEEWNGDLLAMCSSAIIQIIKGQNKPIQKGPPGGRGEGGVTEHPPPLAFHFNPPPPPSRAHQSTPAHSYARDQPPDHSPFSNPDFSTVRGGMSNAPPGGGGYPGVLRHILIGTQGSWLLSSFPFWSLPFAHSQDSGMNLATTGGGGGGALGF